MITRQTLVVGPFQCNCSILMCEETKETVIIDAGDEFERIRKACEAQGAKVKYSLHTHAHLDHIGAVEGLKAWRPEAQICLHRADDDIYRNLVMQGQLFGIAYNPPPPVDRFIEHEELLELGGRKLKVIHTPGHSPGGVCFRFEAGAIEETPVLFSGDTLFQQSIGRTDLWGGDHRQLIRSIKDRILTLEEETQVLPGHGPATSIHAETRENPFL